MTAIAAPASAAGLGRGFAVAGGLVLVVAARWAATISGVADALTIGLGFGIGLTALALVGGQRVTMPQLAALLAGAAGGLALVALAIVARQTGPAPSFAPAAPFGPWAAITIVVATGEELVLRGAVFGALQRRAGVMTAVAATSVVFALMHVPLYGWHVVPLDLGVGIWFAGLRLLTGGPAAPAVAHAVADLATWWL